MKLPSACRVFKVGLLGAFSLTILSPKIALAAAGSEPVEISWFFLCIGLLGGLSLFLYGMERMSDALKNVAGEKMKDILGMLSNNRFMGMITGALVTAVIQSSSVTTVMLVGFVTAGLMSLSQTIGVIMGSNIGTTITAQIVAFKVTKYALLLMALGFAMLFSSKREKVQQYGYMIMGLGMIFFGMGVMSDAMKPLRTYQPFLDLMSQMSNPILGILVAALFYSPDSIQFRNHGCYHRARHAGTNYPAGGYRPILRRKYRHLCHRAFSIHRQTTRGRAGIHCSCGIQCDRSCHILALYRTVCGFYHKDLPFAGRRFDRPASCRFGFTASGGQCTFNFQWNLRHPFSAAHLTDCSIRLLAGSG